MSGRIKVRQIISNMQRAATMPIIRQRLNEAVALKEGEKWVAYAEAKVKGQPGDVVVTNQRLILQSEGETIAMLPHKAINIISIASLVKEPLVRLFYDVGSLRAEMVMSSTEQAEALVEVIAEARGTWPIVSPGVELAERGSSEITVSMVPPSVKLSGVERGIVAGTVQIKFPKQCAWCGSEQVTASRWVKLYARNPRYTPGVGRALKTLTGYAVGGTLGAGLLRPDDIEKIKGTALNIAVPHCADHADTSPERILDMVSAGLTSGETCHIRVRDAEFAYAIARANLGEQRPWRASPTRQLGKPAAQPTLANQIRLPVLRGLVWPDQCVVCGAPNPSERYQAKVGDAVSQNDAIEVPICANDQKRLQRSRVACGTVLLTGLPVAIVLGWLTVVLLGGLASGFVRGGAAFLVGVAGYWLWAWGLFHLARRTLGVDALLWNPVEIKLEDGQYLLKFYNAEMAECVRQANGLSETI